MVTTKQSVQSDSVSDYDFQLDVENKRLEFIASGLDPNEAMQEAMDYGKRLLAEEKEAEADKLADDAEALNEQEAFLDQREWLESIVNLSRGSKGLTYDELRKTAACSGAAFVDFKTWLNRVKSNG